MFGMVVSLWGTFGFLAVLAALAFRIDDTGREWLIVVFFVAMLAAAAIAIALYAVATFRFRAWPSESKDESYQVELPLDEIADDVAERLREDGQPGPVTGSRSRRRLRPSTGAVIS